MISPDQVSAVLVTRGDVDLTEIYASLGVLGEVIVWDNSREWDCAVFGRYIGITRATHEVIYVQDDDCVLPRESILELIDAYEPGVLTANMPLEFRQRYTDSCLVGLGSLFDRDLPARAFQQFYDRSDFSIPDNVELFERTCDVVFSTLTERKLLDLPVQILDRAYGEARMFRQPHHTDERRAVLEYARAVRDGVITA